MHALEVKAGVGTTLRQARDQGLLEMGTDEDEVVGTRREQLHQALREPARLEIEVEGPTGALDTAYSCDIEKCLTLHLVNNKGERFMANYAPKLIELAPRAVGAPALQLAPLV